MQPRFFIYDSDSNSDTERDEYASSDYEFVYINTLLSNLPMSLAKDLKWIIDKCEYQDEFLEAFDRLIRFISGGPHYAYAEGGMRSEKDTQEKWKPRQAQFRAAIREVHKTAPKGPFVPDEAPSTAEPKAKRRKIGDKPSPNDRPRFTLHSISTTSPIRKKVDITIHKSSIQFNNPASREFEASVPIDRLKRAFILPSRDTAKRQWTVVLMSTDYVESKKKKRTASSSEGPIPPGVRVIFKIDKNPTTKFETTNHKSLPKVKTTHDRSSDSYPHIQKFMSYLPQKALVSLKHSSRPTAKNGSGKVGRLWLTKESGILWDESKSYEFWAMEDISGVRVVSDGKESSVYITRRNSVHASGGGAVDGETLFTLSANYQDQVDKWVHDRKSLFDSQKSDAEGQPEVAPDDSQGGENPEQMVDATKSGGTFTISNIVFEDGDDEDDEDFEMGSDDDSDSSSGELSGCVTEEDYDMNVDEGNIADDEQEGVGEEKAIETEKARDTEDGTAKKAIEQTLEQPPSQPRASSPNDFQESMTTAVAVIEDVEMDPPPEEREARDEEGARASKKQNEEESGNGGGQDSRATGISSPEQNGTFPASQEEEDDEIEEEIDELDD